MREGVAPHAAPRRTLARTAHAPPRPSPRARAAQTRATATNAACAPCSRAATANAAHACYSRAVPHRARAALAPPRRTPRGARAAHTPSWSAGCAPLSRRRGRRRARAAGALSSAVGSHSRVACSAISETACPLTISGCRPRATRRAARKRIRISRIARITRNARIFWIFWNRNRTHDNFLERHLICLEQGAIVSGSARRSQTTVFAGGFDFLEHQDFLEHREFLEHPEHPDHRDRGFSGTPGSSGFRRSRITRNTRNTRIADHPEHPEHPD